MKSTRQQEIEDDIRSRRKGMLTLQNVIDELGMNNRISAMRFLDGLPAYDINGRRRWRISDVAKRIAEMEV